MAVVEHNALAHTTLRGAFWTYASYYSGKLMVFVSTIVLARLLPEEDFGVAGYALVVVGVLDVLSDLGIASALIYFQDSPEMRDTAFWLGLGISLTLFVGAWILAPLAGAFFSDPRAIPVIRALALTFPLTAFSNVHETLLRKELAFERKFLPDFCKAISKGMLSITLASLGFGAWSLIWGQVGGTGVAAFMYWRMLAWRPSLRFIHDRARALLRYGIGIVAVNALGVVVLSSDYLFLGRFLGAAALGVYTLAFRIPELLILQFCHVIATVLFPLYTRLNEDRETFRAGFLVTTRYVSMVTVPLGLGLALVAQPFVLTVFTDKWVEAIPVLRAISIYALLFSLSYNAGDVYKAEGRPALLTKLGLVRGAILLPALYIAVTHVGTIKAVAWVQVGVALLTGTLNLLVAARLLDASIATVVGALQPAFLAGTFMAVVVAVVLALLSAVSPLAQLVVSIVAGILSYIGALWLFQRETVLEMHVTLRGALGRT